MSDSKPDAMSMEKESLLEFPCSFPMKIMGLSEEPMAQTVLEIMLQHVPDFDGADMEMRSSRTGKYISLTCTINAVSKAQLDALYRELSAHPLVKFVL